MFIFNEDIILKDYILNTNNSGISLTAEAVDQMVSKTFPNKCFC
jgi:hypothetical protein